MAAGLSIMAHESFVWLHYLLLVISLYLCASTEEQRGRAMLLLSRLYASYDSYVHTFDWRVT